MVIVAPGKIVGGRASSRGLWGSFGLPALLSILLCGCTDLRPVGRVTGPIRVLVWNNALTYGHVSRVKALPHLQARELTDDIKFDTTYAHTDPNVQEGDVDQDFDASVFTDEGLERYDVVLFLNTTGNTIDDDKKAIRRQALQDFIEKKGRGFVGTHSATDTYQADAADPWSWYVAFIGTNYAGFTFPQDTQGVAQPFQGMTHPILTAARTPIPWNRSEEWFLFTSDPLFSSIAGVKMLLTCHDQVNGRERPSAWVHEMPAEEGAPRGGRLFYTAFGHFTSAFEEPEVIDLIIAGIKWAAGRL